jgi:hypothetical protein
MLTEVVAVLDKTDGKTVRLCDAHTGRILADSAVTHDCEVSIIRQLSTVHGHTFYSITI